LFTDLFFYGLRITDYIFYLNEIMKNENLIANILAIVLLSCVVNVYASTNNVVFLNTGKMYVGTSSHSSKVALYIPQAFRDANNAQVTDSVDVELAGYMELGGNFFHDAAYNAFRLNPNGYTKTPDGVFRFSGNHSNGARRYITTYTSDSLYCTAFDRGAYYAAFPNIVLDSNDTLVVPARMGVDATTFKRGTTNASGYLVLRSDKLNPSGAYYDYDASLRITGSGSSASLVDAGSVIVEREMSLYRYGDGSSPSLFPFATPFNGTQLSGYFAGNWVRRPLVDASYGGTTYIYGNKDNNPADNYIDMDQYVYIAAEKLVPAQAYLIKPRPTGYDYSILKNSAGLWYTDDAPSAYDKGKFYFNGKVYTVTPYSEQLFAEDNLKTLSATGTTSTTVNWLVGNSYTSPISTVELAKVMEKATGLSFASTAQIYVAGSQSYVPVTVSGSGDAITVSDYKEIPAMSVFMLTLKSGYLQNGTLSLGKALLKHGKYSHGNPSAVRAQTGETSSSVDNQINFRVYPADNLNVFDLAAVGLRQNSSAGSDDYDVQKLYNEDNSAFQVYSLSETGTKLVANGVPLNTDSVQIGFKAPTTGGQFIIEASNVSTLSTGGAWMLDKKTSTLVDLYTQNQYTFTSEKSDATNRFTLYFKVPKSLNASTDSPTPEIEGRFTDNALVLKQLGESDLNSLVRVLDVQGRILSESTVNSYPEYHLQANYPQGVYVVQVKGARNQALKVVKN